MSRKSFIALWLIAATLISSASAQEANKSKPEQASAVVRVDSGQLQGVEADGVISFKGIPFAAPPVGELRWRPPQPTPKWTGVRQATEFGRSCRCRRASARRNPPPAVNEIMQTLQQLVEQNRLANERYERLLEKYEQLDERNARLKQGLIQNLREFYAILLETLSASIGARRLTWNYVAYTVLKQSGSTDDQIKQRYEAEKKAWIGEKDKIADALEEAIKKMPPQQ